MANAEHLAILNRGSDAWREWRESNPKIVPDLRGADLRGANLAGDLAGTDLRGADLQGADLSGVTGGLQREQLAGAILTGARLPEPVRELLKRLDAVNGISERAQKLFFAILTACLYCWLTVATTTDVNLLTNRASSPLPVIQTSIPIVGFYVVAPLLLLAVYFYFHFYLQKLWEELGSLPAFFPDGAPLQGKADAWLLSDLVRSHLPRLSAGRPFLSYLQTWISVLLAWWLVPITLLLFWGRYLTRHDPVGTIFHCLVMAASVTAAVFLYRLMGATLRGAHRRPFSWKSAFANRRSYSPAAVALASAAVFAIVSLGVLDGVRSGSSDVDWWPQSHGYRSWAPRAMSIIGFSPFADLRLTDVSLKPPTWTGKSDAELDSVKGLRLNDADLRYADIRGAFLAKTVLTDAHLERAELLLADLRQTELVGTHLEGADLLGARLEGADADHAHLAGADLVGAHLNGTTLTDTDLAGANLLDADLTGADIKYANLAGAKGLRPAQLRKAKNSDQAIYDDALLAELKLGTDHNARMRQQQQHERAQAERDPTAAELARAERFLRLVPEKDALAGAIVPMLISHQGGGTQLEAVPVSTAGPANRGPAFSVSDLAKLYDFPTGLDGSGEAIGILEFGGGYRESDLDMYFTQSKLPRPNVTSVSIDGAGNHPSQGPGGADSQVELDIEVTGSIAPRAQIIVYFAPFNDQGWIDAIKAAQNERAHRVSVLSIGWGYAERQSLFTDQAMQNVNEALHLAALSGITICVASGDDGARSQVNDGKAHVDFPASSPWVLAIGGTRLIAEKDSIKSEVVWSGTGGGVSDVFPQPEWQSGVKVPARADGQPGRGVPDVAANADPETGYKVEIDGQWAVIGGTSATAPLWAGLIALLNQGLGRPIGYVNPVLYKNIGSSAAFHGIVTGNNGVGGVKGYSAGPGWNACTGWGSPDGKRLLEALRKAVESHSQT